MKDKRTYASRADYLKRAVAKRRKKIREMAVEYKGGSCQVCGYHRCLGALEFHHPDPSKKDFSISMDGLTRSWKRVKSEIEKCVLVCANCHREIHAGLTQLPTVTSE
ncbi:HNH endonuclease [Candidatus Uhrbacteria bacterium]|nr:HNH endonuclease [Candidatus Uhrbacteria bacterium]